VAILGALGIALGFAFNDGMRTLMVVAEVWLHPDHDAASGPGR